MDFESRVKLATYQAIADSTQAPTAAELSAKLGCSVEEVREAFERLYQKRLLVLEPDTREIRMAPPFSAVPTPFLVSASGKHYYANCVWDALGVAAALHRDVDIATRCGCCDEPLHLRVRSGAPEPEPCVGHFAVPAANWWDDITYT